MAVRLVKELYSNPTARGLVLLTRPFMSLLAGFTSLVALKICEYPPSPQFVLLFLTNLMLFAGGMVTNDCFDVEIDRINKPSRPLPSGLVTERQALWFAIVLYVLGIVLAFRCDIRLGIVSTFAVVGSVAYSKLLKRKVVVGNWFTAMLCCYPFISAGLIAGFGKLTIPIATTIVFIFGREILKAVEDMQGDKAFSVRSVPLWLGREGSIAASIGIMTLALGIASLQFWRTLSELSFLILLSLLLGGQFFLVIRPVIGKARANGVALSLNGSAALMLFVILGFSVQGI